jgi:hypothetical protein
VGTRFPAWHVSIDMEPETSRVVRADSVFF